MKQKKGTVWHQTDSLHYRVLKRSYVEFEDGIKWEVSTVLLEKENPANLREVVAVLRDMVDDVKWLYETIIFKIEEGGRRASPFVGGGSSYGFYRSDDSEDIVKAHDQIVSLIAERKLTPIAGTDPALQISPHIVQAMIEQDTRAHSPTPGPKKKQEKHDANNKKL